LNRGFAAFAAAAFFLVIGAGAIFAQAAEPPQRIEIKATLIDSFEPREPSRRQFGALEFRGGLELSAPHRQFGGLSAIRVAADGSHFIALTDKAHWLRGRIVYKGATPSGIADAEIAPILGPDGKTLGSRGWFDTEALAEDSGTLYVGLERVHRILRFDYRKDGLLARGQNVTVPPAMGKLPFNRGIECLLTAPKTGALIAISERGLDEAGNIRGFLIGGKAAGEFTVRRKNEFDIVDCALTFDGGLVILERYFTWRTGVAIRLRRLLLAELVAGAVLDGPVLIEADMGYQIDNMEGLSIHRAANGDTVLTLISDDNFSVIQRTILLQFTLQP
jgi:hypothetical protein